MIRGVFRKGTPYKIEFILTDMPNRDTPRPLYHPTNKQN